ncbi:hypothetical protein HY489_04045 [Candidatus Woesearchaeota archaeon]|nr:hypothetical protein [Candidatus Woesearchaeota archaeon]
MVLYRIRVLLCPDCSKHLLAFGVAYFVLKHAAGVTVYDVSELHVLGLDNARNK